MTIKLRLTQGARLQARVKPGVPGPQGEPGTDGTDGTNGGQIFVQNSAPLTIWPEGSLWIDADSTDLDLYVLTGGVWSDTGKNLKGEAGDQIFVQTSAPSTSGPEGSLWIDTDSADIDLYTLTGGAWVDTGTNLKGPPGGTPGGANTQVQFNNTGSFAGSANLTFNDTTNVLGGTDLVVSPTGAGGLFVDVTNPTQGNDPNFRRGAEIRVNYGDPQNLNPTFSSLSASDVTLNYNQGQNTFAGGTNAKITAYGQNITVNGTAAGQRFVQGLRGNFWGMGDCSLMTQHMSFAGGNISGDEGAGYTLVNSCFQQRNLVLASIVSVPTAATINTTTTQVITADMNEQTVNVVSSTGVSVGQWVVVAQAPASGVDNLEVVQITAVPSGTQIRGRFRHNQASGATIKPALVLETDQTIQFGEGRLLVNLSGSTYSTGTVSSITGGAFTGSGTSWANNMVGGNADNIGAISLNADTYTGDPFNGSAGASNGPARAWYSITSVGPTSLSIHSWNVSAATNYKGLGPGSGGYIIRPGVRVLKIMPGNLLICETSTHTWSVGHNVELTICPWADVTGFDHRIGSWLPGGTQRSLWNTGNAGARRFDTGIIITGSPQASFGSNADLLAFDIILALTATCNKNIVCQNAAEAAIAIQGDGTLANSKIEWANAGTWLAYNSTNKGMQLAATQNNTGSTGRLDFVNADVAASGVEEMKWWGLLNANKGVRSPGTSVSSLPSAAANTGVRYMVNDANATTFWTIVAGGGANVVPVTSDGTNWRIG